MVYRTPINRVGSGGVGSVIGCGVSGSVTGAGGSVSGGKGIGAGFGMSGLDGSFGVTGGISGFSIESVNRMLKLLDKVFPLVRNLVITVALSARFRLLARR